MLGNGRTALADALDIATAELEMLIDRHFAAHRTLVVEDEGKFWTASIRDEVLYRSPDGRATLRFARTFAAKPENANVVVRVVDTPADEAWSVRVPLADVVPIGARGGDA